jgi:putative tryptophan/tyrosine transport system substrate-binding protein
MHRQINDEPGQRGSARGASPQDLPVELPVKYDLVVNLIIAKALRLTTPESFLARADKVIE